MTQELINGLLQMEWADRDDNEFAALVFCLEQTQPFIPTARFN